MKVVPSWHSYYELCKPRVVALMLLTSVVGMLLATHGIPWRELIVGTVGIGLSAAAGGVINQLIDRHIDRLMGRTRKRPIPSGQVSPKKAAIFALLLSMAGMLILILWINLLTAVLTFLTLIGYAFVYTVFLKRATPQNIVIGGLAGATPPLLGWTAVTGSIDPLIFWLVLLIYTWTPPHFWALAIARYDEYKKAEIPMLPVTHGIEFTKLCIVLYTIIMFIVSLMPFVVRMSGVIYLAGALILGIGFIIKSVQLYANQCPRIAMKAFYYSIFYLMTMFILLLTDHYFFLSL